MATYPPPIQNLPIFNPDNFVITSGFNYNIMDTRYLKKNGDTAFGSVLFLNGLSTTAISSTAGIANTNGLTTDTLNATTSLSVGGVNINTIYQTIANMVNYASLGGTQSFTGTNAFNSNLLTLGGISNTGTISTTDTINSNNGIVNTGTITSTNRIICKDGATKGSSQLMTGDTLNTGYLEFCSKTGARLGYVGNVPYDSTSGLGTGPLYIVGENNTTGVVITNTGGTTHTTFSNGTIFSTGGMTINSGGLYVISGGIVSGDIIRCFNDGYDLMGLFATANYGNFLHIGAWNKAGSISKNIVLNYLGGNVGIGLTSAPTARLDVVGDIKATTTITTKASVSSGSINLDSGYTSGSKYSGFINIKSVNNANTDKRLAFIGNIPFNSTTGDATGPLQIFLTNGTTGVEISSSGGGSTTFSAGGAISTSGDINSNGSIYSNNIVSSRYYKLTNAGLPADYTYIGYTDTYTGTGTITNNTNTIITQQIIPAIGVWIMCYSFEITSASPNIYEFFTGFAKNGATFTGGVNKIRNTGYTIAPMTQTGTCVFSFDTVSYWYFNSWVGGSVGSYTYSYNITITRLA